MLLPGGARSASSSNHRQTHTLAKKMTFEWVAELSGARLHSLRAHLATLWNNSREREEEDGQLQEQQTTEKK
ncbi:hypothetical protein niasHT_027190 [Heterodera trifolii]|uniref:Uncharacterized protein n=1 Tax=Heterodera trifolii TaxID=157864 RepID=A0ABD2KNE9_9BILA